MAIVEEDKLVTVENVSRYFEIKRHAFDRRPQLLTAVDQVSLDIRRGECLGLVGESGSGKSTLARLVVNLLSLSRGRIVVAGTDVSTASAEEMAELRRHAQIIFQDPYSSLDPRFTITQIVGEGLPHLSKAERRRKTEETLERVGLAGDFGARYPHQLSGGQRQRVSVARALAVEPEFLVLDEPVSALDVSMQAQVLNLLQDLQQDLGLTYLFISHDLAVIRHIAHRVAVMYLGQIVEVASTKALFDSPQHPYTNALLSAVPSIHEAQRRRRLVLGGDPPSPIDPPSRCRFSNRCFRSRDVCWTDEPPLEPPGDDPGHRAACFFPGPLTPEEARGQGTSHSSRVEMEGET
jgi:oligopeptide transport system ATP-binding protein